MSTPYWVQDSVFYQIFPDRFANGDKSNYLPGTQKWGSAPTNKGFQGGDFRGIIQHLDYLIDLGITSIYLNPIFQSTSNHRYNTCDYFTIDSRLGTLDDFKALIEAVHRSNIRIILDGVFNHCGRGFFPFTDVLENGEDSAYKDWFHINQFPVNAYSDDPTPNYTCWWNVKSLPKLNTSNPQTRKYIFEVARYWINLGVDGWRLDVPNEIDDDDFWAEFRQVVKSANRDAYLLGEIWTPDARWANDKHFDGLMNYPIRDALLRLLGVETLDLQAFADKVEGLLKFYSKENVFAMYLPSGSHDTERLFTKLNNDVNKTKLVFLFLMAYPGAPAIYYGDEIGMEGGKDPECRKPFPWDESQWRGEIRAWIKNLISLRKKHSALRRGEYKRILLDQENCQFAFSREIGDEKILAVFNFSNKPQNITINCKSLGWKDGHEAKNLLDLQRYVVSMGKLTVSPPAWNGILIG